MGFRPFNAPGLKIGAVSLTIEGDINPFRSVIRDFTRRMIPLLYANMGNSFGPNRDLNTSGEKLKANANAGIALRNK